MMERTVVFIRFYYHIITVLIHQHVRMIIHADTPQKRIHRLHQVGYHRTGGGLTMSAGYAEGFLLLRDDT